MERKTGKKPDIWFVYDGQCPLCQMGASLYKVRKAVGTLTTIDARSTTDHPIMHEINDAGLDIDQGMVIKYQNKLYQGEKALVLMANIGATQGLFNVANNSLFKSAILAKLCYPFMKGARNIALMLKGIGKINNLDIK